MSFRARARMLSSNIGKCGDKYGGRVLLVGDATHPVSPTGGAGAHTTMINAADQKYSYLSPVVIPAMLYTSCVFAWQN